MPIPGQLDLTESEYFWMNQSAELLAFKRGKTEHETHTVNQRTLLLDRLGNL